MKRAENSKPTYFSQDSKKDYATRYVYMHLHMYMFICDIYIYICTYICIQCIHI